MADNPSDAPAEGMIAVEHEGAEITVKAPKGWASPEVLTAQYTPNAGVRAEINQALVKQKTELLDDADFKTAFAEHYGLPLDEEGVFGLDTEAFVKDDALFRQAAIKRGIELGEDGLPVHKGTDLKAEFAKWKKQTLNPVAKERDLLKAENETLSEQGKVSDFLRAGVKYGIDADWMKPVPGSPSQMPAYAQLFASNFRFDKVHGHHAQHDGKIFIQDMASTAPERPHVDIDSYMKSIRAGGEHDKLFADNTPGTTGLPENVSGTRRRFTGEQIGKMSSAEYLVNKAAINEAQQAGRVT